MHGCDSMAMTSISHICVSEKQDEPIRMQSYLTTGEDGFGLVGMFKDLLAECDGINQDFTSILPVLKNRFSSSQWVTY